MKEILAKIVFVGIIVSTLTHCENNSETKLPNCIEAKIEIIKQQEVTNPPTQVWKWEVDGKTYYYSTTDCCDQFNYLYNTDCELVCAPDGGITGQGDGNCPTFEGEVTKTLIWEDSRN